LSDIELEKEKEIAKRKALELEGKESLI